MNNYKKLFFIFCLTLFLFTASFYFMNGCGKVVTSTSSTTSSTSASTSTSTSSSTSSSVTTSSSPTTSTSTTTTPSPVAYAIEVQHSGPTEGFNALNFINSLEGWTVGQEGLYYKTIDGGDNWTLMSQIVGNNNLRSVDFIDSNTGYVAVEHSGIYKTTTGGTSFASTSAPTYTELCDVYFTNSTNGFAGGKSGPSSTGTFAITTNGAVDWAGNTIASASEISRVFFISNNYWAVTRAGEVLRSTNSGNTWNTTSLTNYLSTVWFTDANNGWVGSTNNGLFKTTDEGTTWTAITIEVDGIPISRAEDIMFIDQDHGFILANFNTSYLLYTNDGGATWNGQDCGTTTNELLRRIYFISSSEGFGVGTAETIVKFTKN